MSDMLCVQDVTKRFKDKTAVDQVSFGVQKGEIAAILGPNGAGKSTIISMILGLLQPTAGAVQIFQQPPQNRKVREKTGVMLQDVNLMPGTKARELLNLVRHYYPAPLSIKTLSDLTGLSGKDLQTRTEKLSGGQKRRLGFALALSGDPELLILDEPSAGIDVTSRKRFWETIGYMAEQGKTVMFSTHYLQEAEEAAERILLFHHGKLAADGSPEAIKKRVVKQAVTFRVRADVSFSHWEGFSFIQSVRRRQDRIYIETSDTDRTLELLFEEETGAYDIQVENGKLEAAFEQLTSAERGAVL
ncbi:ABC transporter ATP-binding protein [Salibacterium aidingense]|uniref:ABC transporter ATP-binding protein n=1 Tax=Salibacterium aidingense TaxID=384933 RepID=UPI003BEDE056